MTRKIHNCVLIFVIPLLAISLIVGKATGSPSARDYLSKGVEAFHLHQREKAISLLQKASREASTAGTAHQLLGWLFWMEGEEVQAFHHLSRSLQGEGRGKEIVLFRIAELNLNHRQKKSLLKLLQHLSRSSSVPTVRSLSHWLAGNLFLEKGDLKRARAQFRRLNFWPAWQLIGPFDNQENLGFDEVYPPEDEIELGLSYPGKRGEVGWQEVKYLALAGYLDIGALLRPNQGAAAYLLTYLYSSRQRPVAFRLSSDGRLKLWLNDDLILKQGKKHRFRLDQDVVGVHLRQGWNKLLLKTCVEHGSWRVALRITLPDGRPVPDLRASLLPRPYRPGPVETAEVDTGLEGYLLSLQKLRPLTPLELSWRAQNTSRRDYREEAIALFEDLISRSPQCAYYHLRLGDLYQRDGKPAQALKAFKEVLSQNPSLLRANYELGVYYTQKKLWERAREKIRAVLKKNPRFLPGQLYLALIFYRNNWLEDAYRQAKEAATSYPDSAWAHNSLGVYAEEKDHREEARREYRDALQLNYTYRDPRQRLINLYQEKEDFKQVIKEYRKVIAFDPLATKAYLGMARCYQALAQYDRALSCCQKVLAYCPRNHGARVQQGKIYYETGAKDRAVSVWQAALKEKPDDIWLRDYLNHLVPERSLVFEQFDFTDDAVEELVKVTPPASRYPKASALVLLDQAVDQVFSDGSSTQKVHQVVKILNEKGINQYSQVPVPRSDNLKLLKAVTVSPEGVEHEAISLKGGVISMPALEVGSIVEWKYTLERRTGGWLEQHYYQTFYFQDKNPMLISQFVLALPADKPFCLYQRGEKITYRKEEWGETHIHIWESSDNPQIYDEYDRPPSRDLVDLVSVSTILSWDILAQWQNSLIRDQFEIDTAIKEKLEELTAGLQTSREKLQAVYDFIVTEIRYLSLSGGIFGKKPHRAVNIFANRYGDCKDKATLMIAMLKQLGIEAFYAGIRVRSTGRILKEVPSCQTNHILVYLPSQEGIERELFVDPTVRYLSFPHLPAGDQNVEAIILLGDGYRFLRTPIAAPEENEKAVRTRIRLNPDGSIEAEKESHLRGLYAQSYRRHFRVIGQRKEKLEKLINRDTPGAILQEARFQGLDNLEEEVMITCQYTAPHIAERSGDRMSFSPLHKFSLAKHFARKTKRIYDLETDFTRLVTIEEKYEIPPGYSVHTIPPPLNQEIEQASFQIHYDLEGEGLICRKEFRLKVLTITQENYESFREFCLAADHAEKKNIILQKN